MYIYVDFVKLHKIDVKIDVSRYFILYKFTYNKGYKWLIFDEKLSII